MAAFAREELAEGDRPIELPTAGNPAVAFTILAGFRGPFLHGGLEKKGPWIQRAQAGGCSGQEKAPVRRMPGLQRVLMSRGDLDSR
jgi:hypothetical protein